MQLPLVMPKPQREPTGRDGSPEVEDRTSPAATDATLMFGQFRVLLRQRRLLAGGVPIELGARAFDILMVLSGPMGRSSPRTSCKVVCGRASSSRRTI